MSRIDPIANKQVTTEVDIVEESNQLEEGELETSSFSNRTNIP